jgi:hypothetical protein
MCIHFPDLLPACGCPDCRVCVDRELPLPLPQPAAAPAGNGFPLARNERLAELLEHRAFAPETIFARVSCALEAPLLGRPAFQHGQQRR